MTIINIPNTVTLFRLVLYFGLLALLYCVEDINKIWVFITIAISNNILDFIDGTLARRLNMKTAAGKFLDAAGDRLCKTFMMCLLSYLGVFPWILTAFHLGFKNQFCELPSYYVEGWIRESSEVRRRLPLYHSLNYNRPWIGFGVILNYLIWGILIFNKYNQSIFNRWQLNAVYFMFFAHTFIRALPIYSIYKFLADIEN